MTDTPKSVLSSGQAAMKSAFLINGGAAVALLAFIGHLVSIREVGHVSMFARPLIVFVGGVLSAALATGVTYVTLSCYHAGKFSQGNWANRVAVFLIALSYLAFALGVWNAYESFLAIDR